MIVLAFCFLMGCSSQEVPETMEPETVEAVRTLEVGEAESDSKVVTSEADEKEVKSVPLFNERYPFAIMISNSPEARPQSGLTQAKVLYEMLVEGRITRYLMVIDRNDDTLIGPVRSARPSYLNTVLEYDAFYSHVGNYQLVYSTIKDFDQFFHGGNAYYRSSHRYAPHNVYARMNDLYASAQGEGYDINLPEEGLGHFNVYEEQTELKDGTPVESISFTYDGYTNYNYKYNAEKSAFYKEINGTPMVDEQTGETVYFSNFFVLTLPDLGYMPNGIHRRIEYVGEGEALYFAQGQQFNVRWSKADQGSPMKFYLGDEELILQPGVTMINFIQEGMSFNVQ